MDSAWVAAFCSKRRSFDALCLWRTTFHSGWPLTYNAGNSLRAHCTQASLYVFYVRLSPAISLRHISNYNSANSTEYNTMAGIYRLLASAT